MASSRDISISRSAGFLRSAFPSSAVVAERPDHPLLFAGPDILVGSSGNLAALFYPKAEELRSWKSLLSRLTATRLALPAHTKCILTSNDADKFPSKLTEDGFDQVLTEREVFPRNIFGSGDSSTDRVHRLAEVRLKVMINYGAVLHVRQIQAAQRGLSKTQSVNLQIHSRSTSRPIFKFESSYVVNLADRSRVSAIASIQSLARKTFIENYELDDGVPYPTRLALDVVIQDSVEQRGLDPGKRVRASAFAGWLLADHSAASDLESYMAMSNREWDTTRSRLLYLHSKRQDR